MECKSPGKHPAISNWKNEATTDRYKISQWADRFGEQSNIGIVTGHASKVDVVDIDSGHGGSESLSDLEMLNGVLPWTVISDTGGGGRHIFFQAQKDALPNLVGLFEGIDIRGNGGFVVAPGSMHISGRMYEFDCEHHPNETPIAPMPQWLLSKIREKKSPKGRSNILEKFTTIAPDGQRNDRLARLSGHLLRRFVDPKIVCELLISWNRSHSSPPLTDNEVVTVIDNVCGLELARRKRVQK